MSIITNAMETILSAIEPTPIEQRMSDLADTIGKAQARIRNLEEELGEHKQELMRLLEQEGTDKVSGSLFAATLVDKNVSRVSWKSVAQKFKPSRQLVQAHTTVHHQKYILVNARKGG